jgi:GNAT superfamily N-acetyltransferase
MSVPPVRTRRRQAPTTKPNQEIDVNDSIQTPWGELTHDHNREHNEDRFCVMVAGECRGYARVTDQGDEVFIDEIAVHPDYRGRGIGTVLLETVLTHHTGRAFALDCEPYNPEVWTDPDSDTIGGMGWDDLLDWYATRGFRRAHQRGGNCCMVREATPQQAARSDRGHTHDSRPSPRTP